MKLATYLREKGESASDFAKRADPPLSRSGVSRLLSGQRKPSVALAFQIKKMTGGKVDLPDWKAKRKGPFVDDLPAAPPSAA